MKRNAIPIFLLLGLLCISSTAVSQEKPSDRILEKALDVGICMGIPGLSVAIGRGDSMVWTGTAGYSDLSRRIPVKVNDRFGIGSITKNFVARVILQMADEGVLDLNKTPMDYLTSGLVARVPNSDIATLRQLINHQSGIPTWEFQKDWIRLGRGDQMTLGKVWGKEETLHYCTEDLLPPTNIPGEKYRYSNTNYTILGLVIESVTGNDAMAEIRRRILAPLGMKETFLESFEEIPGGYVNHYHYASPGFIRDAGIHRGFPEVRPMLIESTAGNLSPEWVAGGMVSSASDLVVWAQALRDGKFITKEMQKEFFKWYRPEKAESDRYQYLQGISKIKNYYNDRTVYGHSGGTLGFTAYMYWFEDTGSVIVMLANVGGMHCGLSPWPVGMYFREVLLKAMVRYLGE